MTSRLFLAGYLIGFLFLIFFFPSLFMFTAYLCFVHLCLGAAIGIITMGYYAWRPVRERDLTDAI